MKKINRIIVRHSHTYSGAVKTLQTNYTWIGLSTCLLIKLLDDKDPFVGNITKEKHWPVNLS